jgi:hypothetical protein
LKSAPAQRILDDRTGDSEAWLLPALFKLLDAVVEERTRGGKARLVRREQLVAIRNDRATQVRVGVCVCVRVCVKVCVCVCVKVYVCCVVGDVVCWRGEAAGSPLSVF